MEYIIKFFNEGIDDQIKEQVKFLKLILEVVYLGKCFKFFFVNWFLFMNGERFNFLNFCVLYNDEDDDIRGWMCKEVIFSVIRNCDCMLVEFMFFIVKLLVRDVICEVLFFVQIIILEIFCLYKGNFKGLIVNFIGVCVGDYGSLFIIDNKKLSLFLVCFYYLVDVIEILKVLKYFNGVVYSSGIVFVVDIGNE